MLCIGSFVAQAAECTRIPAVGSLRYALTYLQCTRTRPKGNLLYNLGTYVLPVSHFIGVNTLVE